MIAGATSGGALGTTVAGSAGVADTANVAVLMAVLLAAAAELAADVADATDVAVPTAASLAAGVTIVGGIAVNAGESDTCTAGVGVGKLAAAGLGVRTGACVVGVSMKLSTVIVTAGIVSMRASIVLTLVGGRVPRGVGVGKP